MTTPKRNKTIRDLLAESEEHPERVKVRRGRTIVNVGNLSATYIDTILAKYEGTALAQQELDGLMLDDVDGALWDSDELDDTRVSSLPPWDAMYRPSIVIGVDPSVAETPRDECGIVVVAGSTEPDLFRRQLYVIEDLSLQAPPDQWATVVAHAARKWGAPVVAEYNQGGALIKSALAHVDPGVRVVPVHSKVNKALRAEPVQMASQQKRIHMVGEHRELEDQMTTWDPSTSKKSPDRLDALVHGCLAFLSQEVATKIAPAPIRVSSRSRRAPRIPIGSPLEGLSRSGVTARDASGRQLDSLPPHMRRSVRVMFPGKQ